MFGKCSKLWAAAGRPKSAEIIKKVLGYSLSYPCITRWNSTYKAALKILESKIKLPELLTKLGIPNFTESELLYLEEYISIMAPIANALDFLQEEKNCFYGYVLPSVFTIKTKLKNWRRKGK